MAKPRGKPFTGRDDPRKGRGGARVNAGRKPAQQAQLRELLLLKFPEALTQIHTLMTKSTCMAPVGDGAYAEVPDNSTRLQAARWWCDQVIGRAPAAPQGATGQAVQPIAVIIEGASDVRDVLPPLVQTAPAPEPTPKPKA